MKLATRLRVWQLFCNPCSTKVPGKNVVGAKLVETLVEEVVTAGEWGFKVPHPGSPVKYSYR
ncbi:hypothetical protein AVEN_121131-1, partial [Araneus ventricosus]